MNKLLTNSGFDYGFDPSICSGCEGNCCIGESGYIWINQEEIKKLSELLGISIDETKNRYLNN